MDFSKDQKHFKMLAKDFIKKVKDKEISVIKNTEKILKEAKNINKEYSYFNFISEEYETLPFCSRWIIKKFGAKALFGLRQLEENGNLHHFPQLIDSGKGIVAQSENTILIKEDGEKIITTREI